MPIRERLAQAIHLTASALLIASVIVMTVQIALRLLFNAPLSWPEEVVRYSFVWVVYLGSVVAVTRDTHIRVTVAFENRGPRLRYVSDVLSWVFSLACWGFLVYWGADLAYNYRDAEFYTLGGWSQLWYYLALPVPAAMAVAFLLVQGVKRSDPTVQTEARL